MFKKLGWAALLVTFFAAPAYAQDPGQAALEGITGQGGFACGEVGVGNNCDGVFVPISNPTSLNIADATNTAVIKHKYTVMVDSVTGVLWPGLEHKMFPEEGSTDPLSLSDPIRGNRGLNAQDLIDDANAIQHLENLADQAFDAARALEIQTNKACAGVPLNLRHILCPQIL